MSVRGGDPEEELATTLRRCALASCISIAIHALLAIGLAGTHAGAAISFAANVPILAAIAWQLPRMRSRALPILLVISGLGTTIVVARGSPMYGYTLTPGWSMLAFTSAVADLAIGALSLHATQRWLARQDSPIDWGNVGKALLVYAAMFAVGVLWSAAGGGGELDHTLRGAASSAVFHVAFVLLVLPALFPVLPAREPIAPAPAVERAPAGHEDPWAGLELPDGDGASDEASAPPPVARPARESAPSVTPAATPAPRAGPTPTRSPPAPAAPRAYAASGARTSEGRPRSAVAALAATALLAAAGGAWAILSASTDSPTEVPIVSTAPATPSPTATPTLSLEPVRPATLDDGEIFGGQTLAWWTEALDRDQGQPRAALLLERARRNGLEVGVDGIPRPTAALLAGRERLGVAESPLRVASGPGRPPTLEALAAAVREPTRHDRMLEEPGRPRVVLAPRPGTRAALRIVFALDPEHDGEQAALDTLAVHAMLLASAHEGPPGLHAAVDGVDGALTVEHGSTYVALTLEVPAEDFVPLARRLLRVTLAPQLSPAGLPAARRSALVETPADGSSAARLLAALVLDRYGFQSTGAAAEEILSRSSPQDVRERFGRAYPPAQAQILVAGAFDPAVVEALIRPFRGGSPRPTPKLRRNLAGTYRAPGRIPFHLLAYPLELATPADVGRALLFAAVLEERLFHDLRDGGQAYAVSVTLERDAWQSFLVVQIPFGPEAPPSLARTVTHAVSTLARADIDDAALERNQRHVLEALRQLDGAPGAWVRSSLAPEGPRRTAEVVDAIRTSTGRALLDEVAISIEAGRAIHVELDPAFALRRVASGRRR